MKKNIVFRLILIPIIWISCDRLDYYPPIFREAEKLMSQHPDSALVLLNRIEQPEQLPEATWARWALLTTQARDKAFIRHTSDSTINRVITYYDHAGNRHQKALAYYYLGRVNSDLGQLERATAAYLRAYDYTEETDDHDLTFRIASQVGTLFARQGLTHEALEIYQRAFNMAQQTNDSIKLSFSHSYLGRIYGLRKDWEQANTHYLQAIEIAKQIQDHRTFRLGIQELSSIYVRQGRLAEALKVAKRLTEFEGMVDMPGNRSGYLVLGNNPDYFNKNIEFNSVIHDRNSVSEIYEYIITKYNKVPKISELSLENISNDKTKTFKDIFKSKRKSENDFIISKSKLNNITHKDTIIYREAIDYLKYYSINSCISNVSSLINDDLHPFPTNSCLPFSKKIFMDISNNLYPCEKVYNKYKFGVIRDNVIIDSKYIANRLSSYYKILENICSNCYINKFCGVCIFMNDVDPLSKKERICNRFQNKKSFTDKLNRIFSFIENNPNDFKEITENTIITV